LVVKGSPINGLEVVLRCVQRAGIDGEVVPCAEDGTFWGESDIVEGSDVGDEVVRAVIVRLGVK
jgi:hypothetical protein